MIQYIRLDRIACSSFRVIIQKPNFDQHMIFQSAGVTLELRSMSLKPYQFIK